MEFEGESIDFTLFIALWVDNSKLYKAAANKLVAAVFNYSNDYF